MYNFSKLKFGEIATILLYWLRAIVLGFFLYMTLELLTRAGVGLVDRQVYQQQEVWTWSNYFLIFIQHSLPAFISTWMLCHYVPAPRAIAARVFSVIVLILLCFYGPLARLIRTAEGASSFIQSHPEVVGILIGTAINMLVYPRMNNEERKRFFLPQHDSLDRMNFDVVERE